MKQRNAIISNLHRNRETDYDCSVLKYLSLFHQIVRDILRSHIVSIHKYKWRTVLVGMVTMIVTNSELWSSDWRTSVHKIFKRVAMSFIFLTENNIFLMVLVEIRETCWEMDTSYTSLISHGCVCRVRLSDHFTWSVKWGTVSY